MLHLIEKVIDHILGKLNLPIAKQPDLNKVAVPAIHLVEAAARHYVGMGKIKKTLVADLARVVRELADFELCEIGRRHLRLERLLNLLDILFARYIDGPPGARRARELRIDRSISQSRVR